MVAAGHPATAAAARVALDAGGNAVDAALAGLCAASVAEPVLASLGGGGFLLARPAKGPSAGRTLVYDFFVQTPKRRRSESEIDFRAVLADFGPATQPFHIGMGAIATPGVVGGVFAAHRDLGRLPMREIVAPAVALARDGVPVDAVQGYVLRVVDAIIAASAATRTLFASPDRPEMRIAEGERLRLPELADTLEILAIEGPDLFYRGEMAARLAADCAGGGGHLSLEDMRGYAIERRAALALDAFGARVELNPPPAAGGVLVGFGLLLWQALGRVADGFGSAEHLLRLLAVMRAGARARTELSAGCDRPGVDPLGPPMIERWCRELQGAPPAPRGTTHISVVDADGGLASLSVSNGEGSSYVIPGTGIVLNNMLGEGDLQPDGANLWPVDVRMSSMMTPALVLERDGATTALGSGGSSRIRTAMLQVLTNRLAFGLPLAEAVAAPRMHLEDQTLSLEPGFAERAVAAVTGGCAAEIQAWPAQNMFFGGVHAVRRDARGGCEGAGDARRGGSVSA